MTKAYHRETRNGVRLQQTSAVNNNVPVTVVNHYSWSDQADGYSNPDWKTKIANGDQATTPFTARTTTCENHPGSLVSKGWIDSFHTVPHERSAQLTGDLNLDDFRLNTHQGLSDAKAIAIADSLFYKRAHEAIVTLEGGELLGELGETVQEIRRLARNAGSLLQGWQKNMKRLRRIRKSWRAATGIVSDSYLRWKFGWDPLISDVNQLAYGLKDDYVDIVPIKASGRDEKTTGVSTFKVSNGLTQVNSSTRYWEETSVRRKAGIRVKRYGAGGLVETLGLSPRNFLPTLYNCLPWTYMLDYFSNLGNIVSAIAFDNARISWNSVTIRKVAHVDVVVGHSVTGYKVTPTWEDAPGYPIVVPSRISWSTKTVSRGSGLPLVPELTLRLPNFATTGGAIQGVNIAAVLASIGFGSKETARFRNG